MNKLSLQVRILPPGQSLWLDGIEFESCALILVDKDGFLGSIPALNEALIVSSELDRSRSGNGRYLIFTNPSGIADDGGWSGVQVTQQNKIIRWELYVDDLAVRAEFDETQYNTEIDTIMSELAGLPENIQIEPSQVVFPESW